VIPHRHVLWSPVKHYFPKASALRRACRIPVSREHGRHASIARTEFPRIIRKSLHWNVLVAWYFQGLQVWRLNIDELGNLRKVENCQMPTVGLLSSLKKGVNTRAEFQRLRLSQSPLSYSVRHAVPQQHEAPHLRNPRHRSLVVTLLRPYSISAFLSAISPSHEASRDSQIPAKAPPVQTPTPLCRSLLSKTPPNGGRNRAPWFYQVHHSRHLPT
jgi:hypothetical protein